MKIRVDANVYLYLWFKCATHCMIFGAQAKPIVPMQIISHMTQEHKLVMWRSGAGGTFFLAASRKPNYDWEKKRLVSVFPDVHQH